MNIVEILESNVARYPDYDKIIFKSEVWSNHRFYKSSIQLAGVFKENGVVKGDRVCLILPINPYAHVTMAATWRIGAVLAPLHFVNPAQAHKDLLDFLQPKVVVTTAVKAAEISALNPNSAMRFFVVDAEEHSTQAFSLAKSIASFAGAAPDIENCQAHDPALILSTSGSTGKPKSGISTHGNWVGVHESARQSVHLQDSSFVFHFEDGCTFLEAGSYGHVGPMVGVVRSWAMKTRVIQIADVNDDFLGKIQDYRATVAALVPAMYERLVAMPNWSDYDFRGVRYWTSSAAPLSDARRDKIEKKLGITIIRNYGMTETCGFICSETPANRRPGSSGRLKTGFEIKTIDENGKVLPVGEVGEICVKGSAVILGYFNAPEATARAFKDGWYHTGDLGRFDREGYVYVIGRTTQVINQGGYKIQPAEVEQVVEKMPAVEACVVTAIPDELLGQAVGVFVKVRKGMSFESKDLRVFCSQYLSEQKVPQKIYVVDQFPLTAANKIDVQKLVRERDAFEAKGRAAAPKSYAELVTMIKEVLGGILGIEPGSLSEKKPLMEAGVTSRGSVAFSSTLGSMLGRTLPSTLIFSHPTIEEIAKFLFKGGSPAKTAGKKRSPRAQNEEIAIVGMALRFPGGSDTPESFWNLLSQGRNANTPIPEMRWRNEDHYDANKNAPMKSYVRSGSFVDDVEKFDRRFFDMSPLAAMTTDPQHRLLLETSWEAMEDAGLTQETMARARGGVYLGMLTNEFQEILVKSQLAKENPEVLLSGGANIAGAPARVSYAFGLKGPCMTVLTTCSSSLVALDLACKDLRSDACDFALVGGVNFLFSPWSFVSLAKMGALSPDGICKTFDASADGYGRGDGLGLLIVKTLSKAKADGDRIWAVVKSTAVNQNGRGSSPTAPSVSAQANLLQDALDQANLAAADVSYIEAHGTGTLLGDPIELAAISQVYGEREKDNMLTIGSAKTNIGHTESAAGVAGVIKTVLAMHHKRIPAHLHLKKLNPMIGDLGQIPAQIPTQTIEWTPKKGRRIAGVSSFGITGTNAHVILEEFVADAKPIEKGPEFPILTFSGKSREALLGMAKKYEHFLSGAGAEVLFSDICYTSNQRRTHFDYRMAVTAKSHDEALKVLQSGSAEGTLTGEKLHAPVFLFTGQGSQYAGMGKELYESSAVFKEALDRCAKTFKRLSSRDLIDLLFHDKSGLIDRTEYAQPSLFALEYALAQYWLNLGVKPKAMLGHSLGEYVAACVANVFSLDDAMLLVVTRARLMQNAPGTGVMASLDADGAQTQEFIEGYKNVSIAAFNAPRRTVISGEKQAVEKVLIELKAKGVRGKVLNVSHAFHSPLMEPILKELEKTFAQIKIASPTIPIISNLTGKIAGNEICQASYWLRHLRAPVCFQQGIETLVADGANVFLEIGSSPTLVGMAQLCSAGREGLRWRWSLQKGKPELEQIARCVAGLYTDGVELNWAAWNNGGGRTVSLPGYAFQRESFWPTPKGAAVVTELAANVIPLVAKSYTDAELKSRITECIQNVLGSKLEPSNWSQSLTELGMNSISAMTLRSEMAMAFGNRFQLPQTFAFDFPTAQAMFEFFKSYGRDTRNDREIKGNPWLRIATPRPNASMRLFCFHFAGGAAQMFDAWSAHFDESIEVCAVQLPGRWERSSEPAIGSAKELASALYLGLKGETKKPFAVFGYSFGALAAVHWLNQIQKHGDRQPTIFFPAAASPPQLLQKNFSAPDSAMSDEKFLETFAAFFGDSIEELKKSAEHRAKFIPIIKADLHAAFTAYLDVKPRFKFPVYAFGGKQDSTLPTARLEKWSAITQAEFQAIQVKGPHFFVQGPSAKTMIERIIKIMGSATHANLQRPRRRRRKA